jgi:hypothetical protein
MTKIDLLTWCGDRSSPHAMAYAIATGAKDCSEAFLRDNGTWKFSKWMEARQRELAAAKGIAPSASTCIHPHEMIAQLELYLASKYLFDRDEPSFARVYSKRGGDRYCIRDDGLAGRPMFRFYVCTEDGEPAYDMEMPGEEMFDRLVYP